MKTTFTYQTHGGRDIEVTCSGNFERRTGCKTYLVNFEMSLSDTISPSLLKDIEAEARGRLMHRYVSGGGQDVDF